MTKSLKNLRDRFHRPKRSKPSPVEPTGLNPEHETTNQPSPTPPRTKVIRFPYAIVIADFVPQKVDELPAKEYDLLALLHQMDENWYLACTLDKQKVGYIPRKYLKVQIDIGPISVPSLSPQLPQRGEFPNKHESAETIGQSTFIPYNPSSEFVPRPPPRTPKESPRKKKLREHEDLFFLVAETVEPISEYAIGAKEGDIMLCLDENVIPGLPFPKRWIYCGNLSGRKGAFPGIFAKILCSSSEIDELLQRAPHAIATKTIRRNLDGYVEIDLVKEVSKSAQSQPKIINL
ncbi:unnamed protein product [Hymenolepis diminuta]|uniref:SH3 domain-containing protein n=1 Tax=Hymenolepis diminuta TaxID=6216 RepID=A0A564YH05_HYMDI|nr:unnamed protein product [Hymenolepis diminuta]